MSYQTVPEMDAANCTAVGVRQASCSTAGVQTGSAAGLLLKASRSAELGPRTGISPPPSTITTLFTGVAAAAAAATFTLAVMTPAA
jgi:hypothetical protein